MTVMTPERTGKRTPSPRGPVALRLWVLAALFAALTAIGAWLRIPLPTGVPFSFQVVFVLLAGGILGPRAGALSQILYLGAGLLGAPVFTEGGGPGYVMKPTFGYLLAFPLAAFIAGKVSHTDKIRPSGYRRWMVGNVLAIGTILLVGVAYLYFHLRLVAGAPQAWTRVVWIGAVVFLPGDIFKAGLAAVLQQKLAPLVAFHSSFRRRSDWPTTIPRPDSEAGSAYKNREREPTERA